MTARTPPVDFRALFDAEFSYVWSVLRRLGVRVEDAEDLAHEVFLTVYRKLSDYEPDLPVRPWLFAFAYRVASDHRRRARHRREVVGAETATADEAPGPDEIALCRDEQALLLDALDQLDLGRRAVLVMHEWDGAAIPEVARALGIPLNTAYSRLRLAREDLAAAVKRATLTRRPR